MLLYSIQAFFISALRPKCMLNSLLCSIVDGLKLYKLFLDFVIFHLKFRKFG